MLCPNEQNLVVIRPCWINILQILRLSIWHSWPYCQDTACQVCCWMWSFGDQDTIILSQVSCIYYPSSSSVQTYAICMLNVFIAGFDVIIKTQACLHMCSQLCTSPLHIRHLCMTHWHLLSNSILFFISTISMSMSMVQIPIFQTTYICAEI